MTSKTLDKITRMHPTVTFLSEEYQPWNRGKGTEVWAMITAVIAGDLEKVKELVDRDPGLTDCEVDYFTPFHFAVRENQRAIVDFLLTQAVQEEDISRASLVEMARMRGYTELTALLEARRRIKYHIVPDGALVGAAIKAGDLTALRRLLDEYPTRVHAADANGNQPIHWAALTRQLPMIDELLRRGANINAQRPDGARPLDLTNGDYEYRSWYRDLPPTAIRKHEVVIGYLIARGAFYDIVVAARMGDYHRVRALLDTDPSLVNRLPDYVGYYSGLPLRVAAAAGHMEVVNLLLERGADPNTPEPRIAPWGGALHAAISSRQYEIVKLLLQHGANVNGAAESSGNCLSMSQWTKAPQEIIDLLVARGATLHDDLIGYAGDIETLSLLLAEDPQRDVSRLVDHAISKGYQAMLELILQYQPDALEKSLTDTNAWWDNQVPDNPAYGQFLLDHGLNPNRPNWLGITFLHRCAHQGNIELADLWLKAGADINAVETEWSATPLGWGAKEGKKEMVEWLLSRGADPRLPAEEPWAWPVEWARRKGHAEIAALLE